MPDIHLSQIAQIGVIVSDVEKALAFYRDLLGLPFLYSPDSQLAFLDAGGVRLMLTTPKGHGAVGHNSLLYFNTHDITRVYTDIVARGAAVERGPELTAKLPEREVWTAFLRDIDGNLVGLMEEKPVGDTG